MSTNTNLKSCITTNPVTDTSTVSRRRVFTLSQLRADYRDAQTQFVLLLTQLHEEGFTGDMILHYSGGRVCHVETNESKKINTHNTPAPIAGPDRAL